MTIQRLMILLSDVPVLATVVCAVVFYRQFGKPLKIFTWYIFLSGFIQFAAFLFWAFGWNNMPLLHLYVALGFPCLAWFYRSILAEKINPLVFLWLAIIFLLGTLANSLFMQSIFRFNSFALALESLLIIVLALVTFVHFLSDTVAGDGMQDRKSLTWINSGLFIYNLSCLLIFYFGDTIIFRFSLTLSRFTWVFHAFFSIVMYTCFSIGLWKCSKTRNLSMR